MKPEELFIGAWVYNAHHKKNIQITPYDFFTHRHDENGVQHLKHHSIPRTGNDLYPIPLTPEILEKNGWRYNDMPFVQGWEQYGLTIVNNRIFCGKNVSMKVEYVHELQLVLRLCGIDKEIVL